MRQETLALQRKLAGIVPGAPSREERLQRRMVQLESGAWEPREDGTRSASPAPALCAPSLTLPRKHRRCVDSEVEDSGRRRQPCAAFRSPSLPQLRAMLSRSLGHCTSACAQSTPL